MSARLSVENAMECARGDGPLKWQARVVVLVDENARLETENARLRTALLLAQWGSCDGCGGHHYCPECRAEKLQWDEERNEYFDGPHRHNCPLGAALGLTLRERP